MPPNQFLFLDRFNSPFWYFSFRPGFSTLAVCAGLDNLLGQMGIIRRSIPEGGGPYTCVMPSAGAVSINLSRRKR